MPPSTTFALEPGTTAGTVTIRGVELAKLGTWAASTGMTTLDPATFADMAAANGDPNVDEAAMKIGHVDTRFHDGEPALGWIKNLRTSPDGVTLLGDLEDVPAGLADVMPAAFRRRSVEIAWNVRTPAGKHYRAVITGLALLGVKAPAVKGLAGIQSLYQAAPQRTAASTVDAESSSSLLMGAVPDAELAAARSAVAQVAATVGAPPAALAALDEALEGLAGAGFASIHPPTQTPGNASTMNEQRLRELLGIEAEADIEAAVEALKNAPPATAPAATAPAGVTTPPAAAPAAVTPAPAAPATAVTPPPAAAPAPAGDLVGAGAALSDAPATVTLSAAQWAEVQGVITDVTKNRRTAAVDAALSAGRIHVTERDAYLAAMERDEQGTTTLLSTLAPKFPTIELGTAHVGGPGGAMLADGDEAGWDDFGKSIGVPALGKTAPTA